MRMRDCLFCKIAAGQIPSRKSYEDEDVLAFYDIDPQAPVHVLVIPKKHIDSVDALTADDAALLNKMFAAVRAVAKELGLSEHGYRVVSNVGVFGQQSVKHLHLHVLGGRQMEWPPG